MPIAEARIETKRSSRYLAQVCRHVQKISQRHPEMQARVEWSDDRGVIEFGWGRCTLQADPGALTLRAEAPDEEDLHRLEHRVAERLEWFGRQDRLTVAWTPFRGTSEGSPEDTPDTTKEDIHD